MTESPRRIPLKIAYCSYNFSPPDFGGGLIREVRTWARLAELGDGITVYTSGRPGFLPYDVSRGMTCHRSPVVGQSRLCRALRRVVFAAWLSMRLLMIRGVGVVFLGGLSPLAAAIAAVCCRLRRIKTLTAFTLVGEKDALDITSLPPLQRIARLAQYHLTTGFVTLNGPLYDAACSRFGKNRVRLIHNGTSTNVFKPSLKPERTHLRREHGVDNNGNVVFSFLGSLTERKGFDVLLAAFDRVAEVNPQCRLWVIGPRNRNENHNLVDAQVEILLRQSKNLDKVHLFGRIDDPQNVAKILSASDVFVFPTRREGFPNAVIEAMSCGVPVLVNRLPGVTDIAPVHGETGFFFSDCDVVELSNSMKLLAEEEDLRLRLGRLARERVLSRFSFENYVQEWRTAFLTIRSYGFLRAESSNQASFVPDADRKHTLTHPTKPQSIF